jgi:hypothetical protein
MQQTAPVEIPVKYGKLPANFDDMSLEEIKQWERAMQEEAKEYLFSIGQPLVYEKDGQMISEQADGSITHLR